MDTDLCISVPEMGKRLHISRAKAYDLANQESFYPAFRVGTRRVVSLEALHRWLAEQTAPVSA